MKSLDDQIDSIANVLLSDTQSFILKGKTYPLRHELSSWGWFWNGSEWQIDGVDKEDPAVQAFQDIENVWMESL